MSANIIARVTPDNRNAIFILDSLDEKGNIQAWFPDQDEVVASNLNYYKTTKSASDAVESELSGKYVAKFGFGSGINIRRKLFRTSKIAALNNGKDAHAIVTEGKASPAQPPVAETSTVDPELPQICIPEGQKTQDELIDKMMASFAKALRDTFK